VSAERQVLLVLQERLGRQVRTAHLEPAEPLEPAVSVFLVLAGRQEPERLELPVPAELRGQLVLQDYLERVVSLVLVVAVRLAYLERAERQEPPEQELQVRQEQAVPQVQLARQALQEPLERQELVHQGQLVNLVRLVQLEPPERQERLVLLVVLVHLVLPERLAQAELERLVHQEKAVQQE
jgi:hypothetical protein